MVLAGALLLGCMPGVAQAKSIKATVTGTVSGGTADDLPANEPIMLHFVIQNYSGI